MHLGVIFQLLMCSPEAAITPIVCTKLTLKIAQWAHSVKMNNSNKEEFNKQITAEGEKMNLKIVTMDVKKIENLQDLLT